MDMISEINSFFDDFLKIGVVESVLNAIPESLKALIILGSAFSVLIAVKRTIIG